VVGRGAIAAAVAAEKEANQRRDQVHDALQRDLEAARRRAQSPSVRGRTQNTPRDRIPISKTSSLQSHRQMGVVMRACCSLYAASHLRRARASQRGPLEYAPRACARYGVLVVGEEMKGLVSPAPKSESRRTDSLIDKRLEIAPIQPERILL
jgi:hypothetical protein